MDACRLDSVLFCVCACVQGESFLHDPSPDGRSQGLLCALGCHKCQGRLSKNCNNNFLEGLLCILAH